MLLTSIMCIYWSFFLLHAPKGLNNDLQPPNYYEVMEFDPLAPATE